MTRDFSKIKSAYYETHLPIWQRCRDMYEATPVINDPESFLRKRKGSEIQSVDEYADRAHTSHYQGLFPEVIDSLAGQSFRMAEEAERDFGTLGDVDEDGIPREGTVADALWNDADGHGTDYLTVVNRSHLKHILYKGHPTYVEGVDENHDQPAIKLFDPIEIPMAFPTEVLLRESHRSGSVLDGELILNQYRHFYQDGYTIYRETKPGVYSQIETVDDDSGVWPWFFSELPMDRNIAYHAAHGAQKIFELESYLSTQFRKVTLGMKLIGAADSDGNADKIKKLLQKASSFLWETERTKGITRFITPETGSNASDLIDYLEKKREEYRQSFFQAANAAARPNVTATQVIADYQNGTGAFQAMMAQCMSNWETSVLRMIERTLGNEPTARVQYPIRRTLSEETGEQE